MEHQELLSGLVRLHVLHHAAEGDLYGNWMIEELARHGYKIGPGTLHPMLRALERKGYLTSRTEPAGRSRRRVYRAPPMASRLWGWRERKSRDWCGRWRPDRQSEWSPPSRQVSETDIEGSLSPTDGRLDSRLPAECLLR